MLSLLFVVMMTGLGYSFFWTCQHALDTDEPGMATGATPAHRVAASVSAEQ